MYRVSNIVIHCLQVEVHVIEEGAKQTNQVALLSPQTKLSKREQDTKENTTVKGSRDSDW